MREIYSNVQEDKLLHIILRKEDVKAERLNVIADEEFLHTYEILEDNTLVYEYKTGPYLGIKKDKEFIK